MSDITGKRHAARAAVLGALFGAAVFSFGFTPIAHAQQDVTIPTLAREPGRPPAPVLILGVFHFHNPNADYAKFRGIDVMAPERQREIEAIVERLAEFAPTRIAVERPLREADSLNVRFARYRAGEFELTSNEVHQLGFRLARKLGHSEVFPVDHQKGFRFDSLMAYLNEHDPGEIERFDAYIAKIVELFDRMQAEEPIGATLRFMNQPENVIRTHEPYAVQATVGAGDTFIGAWVVADWYERNLAIFANLARITRPDDRVLFIVGAGHTPILRELVRAHPDMELVEAIDYLPTAR